MYLENTKPPIIIVTPRISDTTDLWEELGVFGLFTCVVLGFTCVVLGFTKGGLTCYTMMHFGLSILSTDRARDLSFPTWTLCRKRSAKQQYLKIVTAYTFIVSIQSFH